MFVTKQIDRFDIGRFRCRFVRIRRTGGLEKYKELFPNIDLVTMDITMPRMDGVTALEKITGIRQECENNHDFRTRTTGFVKKSLLLGANDYIVKPLDRKKVLERIVMSLKNDIKCALRLSADMGG